MCVCLRVWVYRRCLFTAWSALPAPASKSIPKRHLLAIFLAWWGGGGSVFPAGVLGQWSEEARAGLTGGAP